jgi:trehalose synthase
VIDPLSLKNKAISTKTASRFLGKYGVHTGRPIISQVSRFDKWKDPIGVVKVFELVRKKKDCQLVLLGNFAADDPEAGQELIKLEKAVKKSSYSKDIHILTARDADNDLLVNAVQKTSAVVLQKSVKEGFGLTVTEAMFKGTPVVASEVGGIPLQIKHEENGFLAPPRAYRKFADYIVYLLDNETARKKMGQAARQTVKEKFLITRLLLDWLKLFNQYL